MSNVRRVYKYEIMPGDDIEIEMPRGAEPLSVQTQQGVPMLWALVDPHAPLVTRRFRLTGTGHDIGTDIAARVAFRFVGTFQLIASGLVFHLFDRGEA